MFRSKFDSTIHTEYASFASSALHNLLKVFTSTKRLSNGRCALFSVVKQRGYDKATNTPLIDMTSQ